VKRLLLIKDNWIDGCESITLPKETVDASTISLSDVEEVLTYMITKESDNKSNVFCYGEKCSRCSWKTIDCNNTFSFELAPEITKADKLITQIKEAI